ncbi:uncharacterized protein LOC124360106 isoform X1 [Homalodisca vitripennis]|uniref:uncharacterized protein LOC124360106 isoform X1 n=2 Tax=Homalodisca vitripennis TaxID=197043 RepID=UPI001EEA8408|nr:uncharacterized protein LOC124360106 isoform X1 [Homalodisca vitripennis]
MEENDLLNLYNSGNYIACIQILEGTEILGNDTKYLRVKLKHVNEITRELLCLNNLTLCQAMIEQSGNEEKWSEALNRFMKLQSNYRSLSVIPLELELNVLHNILWWFLTRPHSLRYKTTPQSILDIVSKCLIKVLKSCNESVLGQESCFQDSSCLITLLKRASDQLLRLSAVVCTQLLSVITLTVHLLLRQQDTEFLTEYMGVLRKAIDQLDLLRLHVQRETQRGDEEVYFKFGLTRMNSTASLNNCGDTINAFVITGSIVCAVNNENEQGMDCLKQIAEEGNSFPFISNYLKAYCCLHSQHYNEAKLCLAYTTSSPLPPPHQAHYRLLLARLLSEQGDHKAALLQCEAALASAHSSPGHPSHSLATLMAASEAHHLHLSTAQLNYLKRLVEFLKPKSTEENVKFDGFEEWCLTVLNQQFSVTVHEAVYTLAREQYLAGYHLKALESYNELSELLKSQICESSQLLPRQVQILHETVLAHLKGNSLTGGEQLCRQLVREYVPSGTVTLREGEGCWEAALYRLEEDVVSMVLLADILSGSDKNRALEQLNRCYNVVSEARDQPFLQVDTHTELCDWLMSRIMLRKARLSRTEDAVHYFRRALIHKPGDKEVMFHYKQWSLWHPDHQSFDPGDHVAEFPADQVYNLALRHILTCAVSEEEWAAFFDHESSQNVLETLFDDD